MQLKGPTPTKRLSSPVSFSVKLVYLLKIQTKGKPLQATLKNDTTTYELLENNDKQQTRKGFSD